MTVVVYLCVSSGAMLPGPNPIADPFFGCVTTGKLLTLSEAPFSAVECGYTQKPALFARIQ